MFVDALNYNKNKSILIFSILSCNKKLLLSSDKTAKGYFELVETRAFSVTVRCAGTLLRYFFLHPFVQITEVDSLVPRDQVTRLSRIVRVDNKTLPFTVTYQFSYYLRCYCKIFFWK